jgi:membrane protein
MTSGFPSAQPDATRGRWLGWLPRHGDALRVLLRQAWIEYERDYARYFAVAMVYYALVSLVPLLLLLLAALGWFLRLSPMAVEAEQQVLAAVETGFGAELRSGLEQLLEWLRDQSVASTLVSVVGLVFTASVLVWQLRMSLRALWRHAPPLLSGSLKGAAWQAFLQKAIAFVMVFGGGLVLFAALAIIVSVQWVGGLLSAVPLLGPGVDRLVAVGVPFVIAFLIFAALFKFLPPVRLRLRQVWLGALLCCVGWFIGVELLALYGIYLRGNVSAYGALGAILIVMIWMRVVSQLFFFGAEVCKVVSSNGAQPSGPALIRPMAN